MAKEAGRLLQHATRPPLSSVDRKNRTRNILTEVQNRGQRINHILVATRRSENLSVDPFLLVACYVCLACRERTSVAVLDAQRPLLPLSSRMLLIRGSEVLCEPANHHRSSLTTLISWRRWDWTDR